MTHLFHFNFVSAIFMASTIICFVIAFLAYNKKRIDGINYFISVPIFFAIWSFFNALGYATTEIPHKILFTKLSYIGLAPSGVSLLIFAVYFSGYVSKLSAKSLNLLYIISILFIISAFTNDFHYFQWESYIVKDSIVGKAVFYKSGLGAWFLSAFSWACSIISIWLMIRKFTINHSIYRKQVAIIVIAFIFPWLSDILFMFRLLPYSEIDWTPASFSFTAILIYISIQKYNSFELSPYAKDLLFNSMTNPVIVLTDTMIICDFNPKADEVFKLKNKIGTELCVLIPEVKLCELILEPTANKEFMINRLGVENWFHLTVSEIQNPEKTANGYVLLFNDITTNKLYQQQLIASESELRKSNESKTKIFSIIAHDLINPFQALTGLSEILLNNIDKYSIDRSKKISDLIYHTSKETHTMLENLLTWNRLQTGAIKPITAKVNALKLVDSTVLLCQTQAEAKMINLSVDVPQNSTVDVDEQMIKTVLRNLVSNAIKFSFPNSTVQIQAYIDNAELVFVVTDSGIGIEPEHLDTLFLMGNKLSKLGTNNEKGTGLGLILCKEFVELNNGKIGVESKIGTGSSFIFTLPLSNK